MLIPFSRELEQLFASDRHAALKILGGGVVGAGIGARAAFGNEFKASTTAAVVVTIVVAVVAMVVVAALLLRDFLKQFQAAGQPVNAFLKYFLCKGVISLVLWIITAFVLAILLAAALIP
jgi:hypothetical protein